MINRKYKLKRKKNKIMKIVLTGLLVFSLTGCKTKQDVPVEEVVEYDAPRHIVMPEDKDIEIDKSIIIGFNSLMNSFSYLVYASTLEGFEITDEIRLQIKYFAEFASCFKTNRRTIDGYFYYHLSDDGALIVDSIINDILNRAREFDSEIENYLNSLGPTDTVALEQSHIDSFNKNIESAIQNRDIKSEFYNEEIQEVSEEYVEEEAVCHTPSAYSIDINGTLLNWSYAEEAPHNNCAIMVGSGSTTDGEGSYFIGHNPGPFNCVYNLDYGDPVTVYDAENNYRTYYVNDIFEVSQDSYFDEVVDRAMPGGETIAMQTCTGKDDNKVRILVAK